MRRVITPTELDILRKALRPLVGVQLSGLLRIPVDVLMAFEPSQIGTIVGALTDASIPHLAELADSPADVAGVGLMKAPGILGDREGYPDFEHESGIRVELKLLYVDPEGSGNEESPHSAGAIRKANPEGHSEERPIR